MTWPFPLPRNKENLGKCSVYELNLNDTVIKNKLYGKIVGLSALNDKVQIAWEESETKTKVSWIDLASSEALTIKRIVTSPR